MQRAGRVEARNRVRLNITLSKSRAPHCPRDCSAAVLCRAVSLLRIAVKKECFIFVSQLRSNRACGRSPAGHEGRMRRVTCRPWRRQRVRERSGTVRLVRYDSSTARLESLCRFRHSHSTLPPPPSSNHASRQNHGSPLLRHPALHLRESPAQYPRTDEKRDRVRCSPQVAPDVEIRLRPGVLCQVEISKASFLASNGDFEHAGRSGRYRAARLVGAPPGRACAARVSRPAERLYDRLNLREFSLRRFRRVRGCCEVRVRDLLSHIAIGELAVVRKHTFRHSPARRKTATEHDTGRHWK